MKRVVIKYKDDGTIKWFNVNAIEVLEDDGFFKVYGYRNEFLGAFRTEIVMLLHTLPLKEESEGDND